MTRITLCLVLFLAVSYSPYVFADTFGTGANQFTIDFVTIGNPGNPPNTANLSTPKLAGSVDYVYRIGKYEVSRDMVIKANAAANLDITLLEAVNSPAAKLPGLPAGGVSWNESARFVNWLNTSQGYAPAYKFATQPGEAGYNSNEPLLLWTAADAGFDPANPFRNSQAHYFLPSINEWYKAAYYDPNANDGAGRYWRYPTGSDRTPSRVAGGTSPGTAVFSDRAFIVPADVTQAGGLSPYGVMGMGGNAFEWQETISNNLNNNPKALRKMRGGAYYLNAEYMLFSDGGFNFDPDLSLEQTTLRVASVPEPNLLCLVAWGMFGLILRARRFR